MKLALIALIPFFGALLPPFTARSGRDLCMAVTAAVTLCALLLLLSEVPSVYAGEVVRWSVEWVPQLGLAFSFRLDGLALFFAALILGIGLLIIVYARYYLTRSDPIGRFYAYLLAFQGAMVGIVLSDNILLLLVFWELTSLTSFLLIGYWSGEPASRRGARMALVMTGGGGLALIAGMLMLGHIAGSYELTEILARGDQIKASPLYLPALLLILLGAFTKSAQFPFHFWLPQAMAAPTPVSAYLHSATMVKAGVFLLARLWPALSGTDEWFLIVSLTGIVTMTVAAWIALFKEDLKALLAYSTVSHLGFMTMLLGFGTPIAAVIAVFHVLNHATFKAALFMCAGIIDHETGTRDSRKLGGLLVLMPITSTLALIATASMAGLPLTNGFLSKEMMLEQAAHTAYAGVTWLFPVLATLAALFSAAYSFRLAVDTFFGPVPRDLPHQPHDPSPGMWLPVAILIVPVIAIGIMPELFAGAIVRNTAEAVIGQAPPAVKLALWHGLTPALGMSVIAILGGALLLFFIRPIETLRAAVWRPQAERMFTAVIDAAVEVARRFMAFTHRNALQDYMLIIAIAVIGVGAFGFLTGQYAPGERPMLPMSAAAVVGWIVLAVACIATVLKHRNRLLVLILSAVVGLIVSLGFMQFSAPDLALTQISVDVVTTILLLLALNLLPKESPVETPGGRRLTDGAIALIAGIGVAGLAYAVMTRGFETISGYHIAQSKPGGGGTNVVNVILVDFRGLDTFGEIIVLGIAGLTIAALLSSALRGAAARRLDAMRPNVESKDAHPLMLSVATRVLLPLILTAGLYILLRGHNLPGGGFIAGLVVAIALIMQYIASGYAWAESRLRFDAAAMIGGGVTMAGAIGLASLAFDWPFLTSTFGYVPLPLIGEVEVTSAMVFDIGVFLTVVGTVLLSLATISRVEHRAEKASERNIAAKPADAAPAAPAAQEPAVVAGGAGE